MTADERRETVLAIADRVFAKRGFAATPTTDVADAADISHGYLFRLFPTKSDLTLAVVRRCNERLAKAVEAGVPPTRDLLITYLHSVVAAISDAAVRDEMRRSHAWLLAAGAMPTVLGALVAVLSPDERRAARRCAPPTL